MLTFLESALICNLNDQLRLGPSRCIFSRRLGAGKRVPATWADQELTSFLQMHDSDLTAR
jgi:hypothetical protein